MRDHKEIRASDKAFREGISLIELFQMFPDNASAEAWFAEQRWSDGRPICPRCGHDNVQVGAVHATSVTGVGATASAAAGSR